MMIDDCTISFIESLLKIAILSEMLFCFYAVSDISIYQPF